MSDSKRLLSGEGDALERTLLESAEIAEPTTAAREAIWAGLATRLTAAPPARGVEGGLEGHGMVAVGGKAGLSIVTKLTLVSVAFISVAGALAGARVLRSAERTASLAASPPAGRTALLAARPPANAPASSMDFTSPSPSLENVIQGDRSVAGADDVVRAVVGSSCAPAESWDPSRAPAESWHLEGHAAGAAPSGAAPSGAAPSGAAPSGAVPSGAAPSGAAPSGGGAPDLAPPSRPTAPVRVALSSLAAPAANPAIAKGAAQAPPTPSAVKPSDAALLLAARSRLRAGSCVDALAKLDDMAGRFPTSVFTQEREAMAIEALDCAGRSGEAADRAARFLHDHPASPYADAVRGRR
jgi:hypothetical protein